MADARALTNAARRTIYETVPAGTTDQILGAVGAVGDILEKVIATCSGAGVTNNVHIEDGDGSIQIPLVPSNAPAGVYTLRLGARSRQTAWRMTTGATATAVAVGSFT